MQCLLYIVHSVLRRLILKVQQLIYPAIIPFSCKNKIERVISPIENSNSLDWEKVGID